VPRGEYAQDIFTLKASYLEGRPPKSVSMYWRRFKISSIPIDDEKAFETWLRAHWTAKDKLLEGFVRTGRFPAETAAGFIESEIRARRWYEFLQIFAPTSLFGLVLYAFYGALPKRFVKLINKKAIKEKVEFVLKTVTRAPESILTGASMAMNKLPIALVLKSLSEKKLPIMQALKALAEKNLLTGQIPMGLLLKAVRDSHLPVTAIQSTLKGLSDMKLLKGPVPKALPAPKLPAASSSSNQASRSFQPILTPTNPKKPEKADIPDLKKTRQQAVQRQAPKPATDPNRGAAAAVKTDSPNQPTSGLSSSTQTTSPPRRQGLGVNGAAGGLKPVGNQAQLGIAASTPKPVQLAKNLDSAARQVIKKPAIPVKGKPAPQKAPVATAAKSVDSPSKTPLKEVKVPKSTTSSQTTEPISTTSGTKSAATGRPPTTNRMPHTVNGASPTRRKPPKLGPKKTVANQTSPSPPIKTFSEAGYRRAPPKLQIKQ